MNAQRRKSLLWYMLCLIVILPRISQAQVDSGIVFQSGLSWTQIRKKAKAEHKYIFMDCYATWCGPCKYMRDNIFPQSKVGEYINTHFISVAVQMDKTSKDAENVRKWYPDAGNIEKDYSVNAYPTYLFFSPDGHAVHRFQGKTANAAAFLKQAGNAIDPDRQYYTMIGQYKDHLHDSVFLKKAITTAIDAGDEGTAEVIGNCFYDCVQNPFNRENLQTIYRVTRSSKDKGFQLIISQGSQVDRALRPGMAERKIYAVMVGEDIMPFIKAHETAIDWETLNSNLHKKYPAYADKVVAEAKVNYYQSLGKVDEYEKAVVGYMDRYGDQLTAFEANGNAWVVFNLSSNQHILKEALKWSGRTIPAASDGQAPYLDTYANLLYKTGDIHGAVTWEQLAIDLASIQNDSTNQKQFEQTLSKMKNKQKTW